MEIIEFNKFGMIAAQILFVLFSAGGFILFVYIILNIMSHKNFLTIKNIFFAFLVLLSGVIVAFSALAMNNIYDDYYKKVIAQAEEIYGITLTEDNLYELSFPENAPTVKTELFGTSYLPVDISKDNVELKKVALVWNDDKLRLFETDEDSIAGKELPRAN